MPEHYIQDSANVEYLRLMADIEHDDPEHAPTYCGATLVCVAGVVLTTPERARELLEDAA